MKTHKKDDIYNIVNNGQTYLCESKYYIANETKLHVVEVGPKLGKPMLLIHGFPDFWYLWRQQVPQFVKEGYRLYMVDLRGYNLSEKPLDFEQYNLTNVGTDLVQLLQIISNAHNSRVYVLGHDWGGFLLFQMVDRCPELIFRALAICGFPTKGRGMMKRAPPLIQLMKSWYIIFFQVPYLPEIYMSMFKYPWFRYLMSWSIFDAKKIHSNEERDHYLKAFSLPGGISGPINIYRRNILGKDIPYEISDKPKPPCKILFGTKDECLDLNFVKPLISLLLNDSKDNEIKYYKDGGHWLMNTHADEVTSDVLEFFAK